jgi:hypothetical protein
MVEGSTITGVIGWADAGFYSEYFECRRMHDPNFMTPGWKSVLQAVFPGEPREMEINWSVKFYMAFCTQWGKQALRKAVVAWFLYSLHDNFIWN